MRGLRDLFGIEVAANRDVAAREILGIGLNRADLSGLAAAGFAVLSTDALGSLGATLHRFRTPEGLDLPTALTTAGRVAPGATFDFNHLYSESAGSCAAGGCWGASLVRLAAPPTNGCARGAPIAMIDTPVDVRHPTLRGAAVTRRPFLSEGLVPAPADHGTAVAALLVGRIASDATPLAPGARLLAAETFAMREGKVRADAAAVLRGLDWSVGGGARVVGLSLTGADNVLLGWAVGRAARRTNLIAAAGNDGPRADPAFPAAYPQVVAVAAVDARIRVWRRGNRGGYVELAAPGVDVISAAPGGGVSRWTGTSFAVPYAIAAMLRARAETRGDPLAARRLLASVAQDIGPPGRDEASGYGLVRAPGRRCW